MGFPIATHRLLTLVVLVTFSASPWVSCCTEARPGDPAPNSQQTDRSDCPPMATLKCCATVQPFLAVGKAAAPAPEFAAAQLAMPEVVASEIPGPYLIDHVEASSPPGAKPSIYLAIAVLRI